MAWSLKKFLFGESRAKLPTEYTDARDENAGFLRDLRARYDTGATTDGELAAQSQTQLAGDAMLNQQAALANSGRGFGAVAARMQAAQNAGIGQQAIAGQGAVAAAQARSQDRARDQGMIAEMLAQRQAQAMAEEEWRRQNAKKGAFGTLLGVAGTAIGAKYGGAEGAQAGGQLGYGVGEAFSSGVRG